MAKGGKSFNLVATTIPWVEVIKNGAKVEYDTELDPTTEDGGYEFEPDETEAHGALSILLSIGDGGRGSAKMNVTGSEISEVADVLRNWDPEDENPEKLSAAQIVQRTLSLDDDDEFGKVSEGKGVVTFRTSLAKHTRTIRVPRVEFGNFIGMIDETFGPLTLASAVTHYRTEVAKLNEAERKRAEAAAKKAAANGTAPAPTPDK